jgi:GNAT superfamily N-acetyltransferase
MPDIHIRAARPGDAEVLRDYNLALALETENLRLDPAIVLDGIRALLADASKGRYFVAECEGRVIGQVMHTFEWSDWRNGMFWWLQSVYVHQEFRSRGVFTALFRHVESLARADAGVCGIRLYMEHENHRARGAYVRLGLSPAGYEVFTTPDWSASRTRTAPTSPPAN